MLQGGPDEACGRLRSVPIELNEALVADPEMVRDLVQDDALRLAAQQLGIAAVEAFERPW